MQKGDRVSGIDCVVERSMLTNAWGKKVGAEYWLKACDDPQLRFVVKSTKVLHSSRVKLSGGVALVKRYSPCQVVVWLDGARIYEPEVKTRMIGHVAVRC